MLGRQLLVDLYGCDRSRLDDAEFLRVQTVAAAEAMGARVVESHCHRFEPLGVSVIVLLSESHMALHTWPEHGAASIDIFVCSSVIDPHRAKAALASSLNASRIGEMELRRGNLEHEGPRRWRGANKTPSV
jgi:S-adenosylmethionine decarboxylase proenzyme